MKKTILFIFISCKIIAQTGLVTPTAMVVSARQEASAIGVAIMKKGGNAFDAMCATELALAVAYPYAGNIGGGGFMVYRLADGTSSSLDFREVAPKKASKNMYLDSNNQVIKNLSTEGGLSIGVPGTIAGIFEVHKKYGQLTIAQIMQPAIDLARKGIVVTPKQKIQIDNSIDQIIKVSGPKTLMAKKYQVGDTIKYFALAETLTKIMNKGADEFYKGETAAKMVAFIKQNGGIINMSDLENYKPVWRNPVRFDYKNLKITTMAPPSSGGITLQQIMTMIAPYNLSKFGHNTEKSIQVMVEAERRAYADRNYFLGDPAFVKIPMTQLLSKDYLKKRMENFSFEKATTSQSIAHAEIQFSESNETTHYSIVDPQGNAVAVTTTLNGAYGSKLYSDELGFFFNNQMDDFSIKPGEPNSYGLIGGEANSIAPNKKMLSSMTPTIVEKDKKLYMVLGAPGGSTIITSVLQTILNVSQFKMTMQQAVDAPRFHHQWLPDEVVFEPNAFTPDLTQKLTAKGYNINQKTVPVIGKVDAILVQANNTLEAGADHRGDDTAAGF